ncbi:MAG: hypothetical protein IJ327_02860 [Lachnospiraceae bacterium]|nr:hypothetical protein [Lachnospiraceae bacterium]
MYFVPDGTQVCGYYECEGCEMRFLSLQIAPRIVCPCCGEVVDMEIGPDEEMPQVVEEAVLVRVVEGDEVELMDGLLSLAITGGDCNWI